MFSFALATLAESIRDKTSLVGMISASTTGALSTLKDFWPQTLGDVLTVAVSACTVGYILTKWVLLLKKGKRAAEE